MSISKLLALGAGLAMAVMTTATLAQPFEVIAPPKKFKTSTEHYEYLKALHGGGTQHTDETVPKWEGLWEASWNSVALRGGVSPFFEGPIPPGLKSGGVVKEGVLTPEFEAAFKQRRENMIAYDEQPYDRLTTCEPAGQPRWMLEPYVREFVNTPTQSWWMNDLANDTRRVYIGQDHVNVDNNHFPQGDSIGFWAGDHLIVHTVDIWPNDWFRGYPPTSNQLESVEIWHRETMPNGDDRIIVQATWYDPLALLEPLNSVYTFVKATKLEAAGYRIRWWECSSNLNITQSANGTETTMALPGEAGFNDIKGADRLRRNPDLPADLPGMDKTPGSEGELSLDAVLGN